MIVKDDEVAKDTIKKAAVTQNTDTILGLDIGTSSIGWALIKGAKNPESIIDMGVRIFPEGVDRTRGEKSLNEDRRIARSLRRQGYRRQRRKTRLLNKLIEAGLLPADEAERTQLWQETDPYQLRAEALERPLSAYELGRALYHLGQRRGYLSNRKAGKEKEDGAVAEGIGTIDTAMKEGGFPTLGSYLNHLQQQYRQAHKGEIYETELVRVRGHYTARRMFLGEFDAIWERQKTLGSNLPNVAQRKAIWQAIFDQRPLKIQKHLVGNCQFETDRKRAQAATLAAQEFRLLQNLNNLKVSQGGAPERWLTDEERHKLFELLNTSEKAGWSKIRNKLSLYEDAEFNLQRVRGKDLQGNVTAYLMSNAIKSQWKKMSAQAQEQLVFDLINIESEEGLDHRLIGHWKFTPEVAAKLKKNARRLPQGYMHLSHKAIRNIIPHLHRCYRELSEAERQLLLERNEQLPAGHRGLHYADAAILAGYHHSQKDLGQDANILPFPGKAAHSVEHRQHNLVPVHELRNPMVERAIYQLRKVINAIIHEYGMPSVIRLEMARDLKKNRRQREDYVKTQKKFEQENQAAEKALKEYGLEQPKRNDLLKYRLWNECERICPFTGRSISMDALFGSNPEFDIEHIIPYSRCMNNSQMNKTLCYKKDNSRKGNRTPFECYSGDQDRYDAIKQRIKCFPYDKRKRFWLEDIDTEEFISQQLNETRYISRKALEYLRQLKTDVQSVNSGQLTSMLRSAWHLNGLLSEHGEKTRLDHRHHAVDALVVALTNRVTVQKFNNYVGQFDDHDLNLRRFPTADIPMPDLHHQAKECLAQLIVSHKPLRKIKGALHEDTFYGLTGEMHKGVPEVVIRKPIESLNAKQLDNIRDERIRQLAREHLKSCNGDFKAAFSNFAKPFGMMTKKGEFRPIRKVRLLATRSVTRVGKQPRHVWTRSNHHIAIFETYDGKGGVKWIGKAVSMLEVARRKQQKQPIVNKESAHGGKLVMVLHRNDLVSFELDGKRDIYRVEKMDQKGNLCFRQHQDADKDDWRRAVNNRKAESLRKMHLQKLNVNVLGKSKEEAISDTE